MNHRIIRIQLGLLLTLCFSVAAFDFNDVRALAVARAARSYEPRTNRVPDTLSQLSYEQHRAIGFVHEKAIWRKDGLPFGLEFFHPGYAAKDHVLVHEINGDKIQSILFETAFFDYGTNHYEIPPDLGFAGFRIVQFKKEFGEVAAFAGASYFRMIGSDQAFGTSARGLALNTVMPEGEEFPAFEQFWIRRPGKNSREITVYALLDSPSAAGAYQFIIRPGVETVATVKASIFPRRAVKRFGLAPLTSMFLHGDNGRPIFADFRPEVHDADGLLIHSGRGEWIWHPLEAGKMMRANVFADENPRGFGLMQRDRDFEHYQDVVAQFERRPSVWVRPLGKWGRGAVELVQLPSDKEFTDNTVAFWVPSEAPKPGVPVELEYEIHWTTADATPKSLGRARATRIGRAIVEPADGPQNLRFVIDFAEGGLESLSDKSKLTAKIHYGEGVRAVTDNLFKNKENGTWRLVIEIADPGKAADLKACLMRNGGPVTETWTFTWQP
jgi:periplasmic glucans biosynthesis protein